MFKIVITSAYSKSSNSSGFNPILQNFYEMICEIIIFKIVWVIFLFFCQSRFINSFTEKNNFSEPQNLRKLNILRTINLKKISAHSFVDLIFTNKFAEVLRDDLRNNYLQKGVRNFLIFLSIELY